MYFTVLHVKLRRGKKDDWVQYWTWRSQDLDLSKFVTVLSGWTALSNESPSSWGRSSEPW